MVTADTMSNPLGTSEIISHSPLVVVEKFSMIQEQTGDHFPVHFDGDSPISSLVYLSPQMVHVLRGQYSFNLCLAHIRPAFLN